MPVHIPYGSFIHVPLGLPNSTSENPWPHDRRSLDGMEVEIVNTMLGGAFARPTDPAFVLRLH